ncbi:DUF927 domain-containing protein [Escherichia coli]|uniref:DUF927 domain-containing protein n=2 Tax=Escherichia coli TaxID=562 RepID=A0A8S7I1I6_ECOLX|nr:DUF927 domain-containing protein [Escherichia coli]EAC1644774.1 DUF927 domain-containing protein [Escherichia coli]EEY4097247.1 DUF927 domain-containing protein [Escherichia coli]EFB9948072.1 DUF927 domain-containing protein [Escherichia coli]EFC2246382.1 DUF927 domain-containing protein [Escherichia coli]EFC2688503.1 DUF927 domain-containing protein [Escherichia coli]
MKNAPNLKYHPKDKFTEVIIFAGTDAYAHAQHWIESEGRKHGDNVPPVYLGPKQLADLANIRIVDDERRFARVYLAGEIEPIQINAIAEKLALAGVQDAKLYKGITDREPENWRDYLQRIREQAERGEMLTGEQYTQRKTTLPMSIGSEGYDSQLNNDDLKPHVQSRKNGIFWVTPKVDQKTGDVLHSETWLCDPLEILGVGCIGKDHYRVMRWKKAGCKEIVTMAIASEGIGEHDGWRILKASGLNVTSKGNYRAILADWIQLHGSNEEWQLSTTTGWHFGAYIMPDGSVIGETEKPVLFTGRSAAVNGYTMAGTAESWRNTVARLAEGNPRMMLGVAVSLAAPLIGMVGADGFGVHLFDDSSSGKTTTQNIASSIWGNPEALRLTWYGTALGIANEAEAHNDGLLPLDEIGQAENARDVATSAYTLFNGSGKLQGAKDGGNREIKRWRTVAISTGEKDVETFLNSEGVKVKAGQLVRLLNIPMVKATKLHEYSNGKDHADALKAAWLENHGIVGREWVKWLAGHKQEAKNTVRDCRERWRRLIPDSYGEQVHRVGERFAILEAALVLSTHVTGWDVQKCRSAIKRNFNDWVNVFGTGNKENEQIIEQATAFLTANSIGRFVPVDFDELSQMNIHNLAGYKNKGKSNIDDTITFYVLPAVFKTEVASGFDVNKAAKVLHGANMLKRPSSGKGWQTRTPRIKHLNGKQLRAYALLMDDELDE